MSAQPRSVRVTGVLDTPSRGLWLVKWLLLIPHLIVLSFLWFGFAVVTVVAFLAILFTGRYPKALFAYTAGVLRWTWRVHYYGYGALGTDRYPPFTLDDVPDFPARLEIDEPARLSRGLVLVKWWLLALPHYLIVGLLVGGGTWAVADTDTQGFQWASGGLIGVLVLIAGVIVLFSGRYPRGLHDLVVGLDRWVLRVAAYAALMTDDYPPFRLDVGEREPGTEDPTPHTEPRAPHVWSGGRVAALVVGALLVFAGTGPFTAGALALWADRFDRDAAGFVTAPAATVHSPGHAVTSERLALSDDVDWPGVAGVVGELRFTASSPDVFIGIGPTAEVDRYLAGVARTTVHALGTDTGDATHVEGTAPAGPPSGQDFWVASTLTTPQWTPEAGDWTVVVMDTGATAPVRTEVTVGATAPALPWIGLALLLLGIVLVAFGALLTVRGMRRAERDATTLNTPLPVS